VKLLLDTHILIWLMEGVDRLPPGSRRKIDAAAAREGIAVSAMSFWEIAMLDSHGRIALSRPVREWRDLVLDAPGVSEIPLSGEVAIESVRLPGDLHGDPADRILVSTARLEGMVLGTRDGRLLGYGNRGHVRTMKL